MVKWVHHPRTLDGAWYAIDDLRDQVDEIVTAAEISDRIADNLASRTRLLSNRFWQYVAGLTAILVAISAIGEFAFTLFRHHP